MIAAKVTLKDVDRGVTPVQQLGYIGGVDDPDATRNEARKLTVELAHSLGDRDIATAALLPLYSAAVNIILLQPE